MTMQMNFNAMAKAALLLLLFLPVATMAIWPFTGRQSSKGAQENTATVSKAMDATVEKVRSSRSYLQETVASAATFAGDAASKAKQVVGGDPGNVDARKKEEDESTKPYVVKKASNAKEAAESTLSDAKDYMSRKASDVSETIKQGRASVVEKTEEVVEGLKDMENDLKQDLQETNSNGRAAVDDKASKMKDGALEVTSFVQGAVKETPRKAGKAAADAKDTGANAATKTKNLIVDMTSKAAESIQTKTTKLTEFAKDGATSLVNGIGEGSEKHTAETVQEAFEGANEAVFEDTTGKLAQDTPTSTKA